MARKDSMERAAQKAGGFASAKKNMVIQYQGRERDADNLMNLVRADALSKGVKEDEVEIVDLYVKPEENAVFYVINKQFDGKITF